MVNTNDVTTPAEDVGLIPCSKKIEPGIFFYPSTNGSNYFKPRKDIHLLSGESSFHLYIKSLIFDFVFQLKDFLWARPWISKST